MNVKDFVPNLPDGVGDLSEVLLKADAIPWREKTLKGLHEKVLWRDEDSGSSIALIRFEKGVGIPSPHSHASNQFMFCLEGKYEYTKTGVTLNPGSFYWNPKGHVHGPTMAHEETIVLEMYDGPHYPQRPDWYESDEDMR
ncbi:MAG TPA: cupin domain-containing protein [Alphaproteobacteria bacterium]|nr:cupin domain-containing protein [Alphaproteobacteria bacterium]